VRWGGIIIQTSPGPAQTCFEISSRPLDEEGEPRQTDRTFGRFMACTKGFYEPSVYAVSRSLTVVGELAPVVVGKVGEHEYRYPMVLIEALHLWPVSVARPASPPLYFYDPFWDFRYPYRYPAPYPFPYPPRPPFRFR
jgi:outer membrane lipoprotein